MLDSRDARYLPDTSRRRFIAQKKKAALKGAVEACWAAAMQFAIRSALAYVEGRPMPPPLVKAFNSEDAL